jgi:formylglycine-generating enzyme required for sulfatase activity
MMRAATGWYVRRMTAIAGILLACLILAGQAWRSSATKTLIERIKDADTPEVPAIIGQSDIPARHAARRLKSAIGQLERGAATGQEATRLARRLFNLRLAWAFYDESQLPTMLQKLGVTESTDAVPVVAPRDVAPVCQMLRQHKTSVVPSLWQAIDDAHSDSARRVLRRASVLAQLDPGSSNWKAVATQVASELVRSPPTQLSTWAELLLPVRHVLVEPLVGFFDTLDNLDEQRNLAEVFTLYAGDDLDRMTGMVRDARPLQLSAALEAVAQHSQRATLHLEKEFSRILKGPQPFDLEDIEDIPPALVNKFRDWSGAVGEKAAFALSIPIGEINKLQIQMGRAGYRPTTFRPYTRADGTDAAVGWRRDGAVSEVRYDLDSTGLNRSDALAEEQDMALTDLCVYRTGSSADSDRFAATWCTEATIGFPQHLSVDLSADAYVETLNEFRASGFAPVRMFARQTDDGEPLFTVLWRKERPNERSSTLPVAQLTHVFRNWYIGWLASDCQLSMIDLNRHDLYASQFYLARHRGGPDSSASKLFAMANHSMRVGKLEDSRSYAEQAFKMEPSNVDYAKLWIRTLCMNGQPSLARKAIDQLATEGFDDKQLTLLRVRVACADGDPSTAMELLASLDRLGTDNTSVWSPDHADAILAHALVADLVGKSDVAQADGYRKRARDLIAVVPDAETLATLSNDPDLDALRKDRSFRQLLETHGLGVRMFGMWRGANDLRSRMSFDMDSKALKAFCEKLLRAGHWPHAISCGYSVDLDQLVGSSIWYKPMPLPSDQIRRDSKLANLAIGLAQLKSTKRLIENLSDRHGRQTRTYVVERLPESGLPASMLMDIFHETNVELVRRNLLLALGGFDSGSMPTNQLDEFVHHLRETLPAHPHAGLRSAGLWCLKTWGRGMTEKSSQQHSRPRQANWSVNSLGKVMIELESPGRVLIGAPSWEEGLAGNEVQHYRIVPRRFALSDTEITVDEFDQFQRDPEINRLYATEGRFTFARDSAPEGACAQISLRFMDAVRFCQWLSQREGLPEDEWCYPGALDPEIHSYTAPADYLTRKGYRLPLEAEWEFACRAGSPLSRHYGESDDILSSYAWYDRNSQQRSHPVAILKPNEWGFFDMLGNVGEWAQDDYRLWHDEETPSRMTDLSTNRERTVRGGFYNTPATGLRSASRTPVQAGLNPRQIGMRVARTL